MLVGHGSSRPMESLGWLLGQVQFEAMSGIAIVIAPPADVKQIAASQGIDLSPYLLRFVIPRQLANEQTPIAIECNLNNHEALLTLNTLPTVRAINDAPRPVDLLVRPDLQADFAYQSAVTPELTLEFMATLHLSFSKRQAFAVGLNQEPTIREDIGAWGTLQWWCAARQTEFDPMELLKPKD